MYQKANTPEEVGVNSRVVLEMLDTVEKGGVYNHSTIILRNGKIAFEKYNAPYSPEYAHDMFSVSKGFISLAVGYLIEEGKIKSVKDKMLDYLPEFEKYKSDARYDNITIEALLTMHSGKKCSFIRHMARGNYDEFFMKAKFKKEVHFVYSNDDVYMLSRIVCRLTGGTVVDYLMPRLFEPLGIERPFWERTTQECEAGSTGLYLKSMDLAKVCQCYLDGGVYEGKQVIPKYWAEAAGKYYVPLPKFYGTSKDYGYYFWGDRYGGYRFDGMFGQWGIVCPKWNAVVVMTDVGNTEKAMIEKIFDYLPRIFEEPGDEKENYPEYVAAVEKSKEFVIPTSPRQKETEKKIEGKTFELKKFGAFARGFQIYGHAQSVMPTCIKATFSRIPWDNFNDFSFKFGEDYVDITWREDKDTNTVRCGMNGEWAKDNMTLATFPFKTLGYAYWIDEKTLFAQIRPIETAGYTNWTFTFDDKKFRLQSEGYPSFQSWALGHMDEVDTLPDWVTNIEHKGVIMVTKPLIKPVFKGKVKK